MHMTEMSFEYGLNDNFFGADCQVGHDQKLANDIASIDCAHCGLLLRTNEPHQAESAMQLCWRRHHIGKSKYSMTHGKMPSSLHAQSKLLAFVSHNLAAKIPKTSCPLGP